MSHQHPERKLEGPIKPGTALHRLLQLLAQAIATSLSRATGHRQDRVQAARQRPHEGETAAENRCE